MPEKVLYVLLPEGSEYQRVIKTEDGKFGIVYSEDCVNNEKDTTGAKTTEKPIPPIGGTAVFQRPETGTHYWYSKLKGRDLFMCLQFADITEQDLLLDANGKKRVFSSDNQRTFKENALKAIKNKPAEGIRWIPAYEPSTGGNGTVLYIPGAHPITGLKHIEWEKVFKKYSPENGSQEASKTTCFMLLMRWAEGWICNIRTDCRPFRRNWPLP